MELITLPDLQITAPPVSSLEDQVGSTPLLPLRRVSAHISPFVRVLAKAEWFNPGGSIKDRPALNILRTALADGSLSHGKRLLELDLRQYGHRLCDLLCSPGCWDHTRSAIQRQPRAH